jgi:hypothetical protein
MGSNRETERVRKRERKGKRGERHPEGENKKMV